MSSPPPPPAEIGMAEADNDRWVLNIVVLLPGVQASTNLTSLVFYILDYCLAFFV